MASERTFRIHRFPQTEPYGCMYHSIAALTGEERWLEYIEDVNNWRMQIRLAEAGYLLDSIYDNHFQKADASFWKRWIARHDDECFRVILTVDSTPPVRHRVAALISMMESKVVIYDPAKDVVQECGLTTFASMRFARCYRAEVLFEAELDRYEPEPPYGERYQRELERQEMPT